MFITQSTCFSFENFKTGSCIKILFAEAKLNQTNRANEDDYLKLATSPMLFKNSSRMDGFLILLHSQVQTVSPSGDGLVLTEP